MDRIRVYETGEKRRQLISYHHKNLFLLLSFLFIISFVLISVSPFLLFSHEGHKEKAGGEESKAVIKRPPKSLDRFYPPKSNKLEFASKMKSMSSAFTAVFFYLRKGEKEKALSWAKRLRDMYISVGKDIPEWKEYIKKDIADEFVRALERGDMKKISEFADKLGDTCNSCHGDNMLSVKVFYYTPDWHSVEVDDPITRKSTRLHKFMKHMTNSLKLAIISVSDKKFKDASKFAKEFAQRAKALGEICKDCHTSEHSIEALAGKEWISNLDKLVSAARRKNQGEFWKYLGKVDSYCTRCHNVHQTPWLIKSEVE